MSHCVFVHIIRYLSIFLAALTNIVFSLISVVIHVIIIVIVIVLAFVILIDRNATVLSGLGINCVSAYFSAISTSLLSGCL
jgi:hypothetical protein